MDFAPDTPVGRDVAGPASTAGDRQGAFAERPPRHHGRADVVAHPLRDGAADARDRLAQGAGRQRDLHLASPERGRGLRGSRRRAARRAHGRGAGPRGHQPRRDDPPDDRSGSEGPLYPACARSTERNEPRNRSASARRLTPTRRSASKCAAGRSSAWRASSAQAGRNSPARSSASTGCAAASVKMNGEPIVIRTPREAIDRGLYLVPEDRKRAGLLLDASVAQNISLPDLALLRAGFPGAHFAGARQRETAEGAPRHQSADCDGGGGDAFGRQPAEGRARQMAVDAAQSDHLRRADARHRRRRQAGDLRNHADSSRTPASPSS